MPQINPNTGDAVAVILTVPNGTVTTIRATIGSRSADGSWELTLKGEPPFRAAVNMNRYAWSSEQDCWCLKKDAIALPSIKPLAPNGPVQLDD
jgi:hypothetical protein